MPRSWPFCPTSFEHRCPSCRLQNVVAKHGVVVKQKKRVVVFVEKKREKINQNNMINIYKHI